METGVPVVIVKHEDKTKAAEDADADASAVAD